MEITSRIAACLWFDSQAEEAAAFYAGIFPNSRIRRTTRHGEAGKEIHGKEPGSVLTVEFELNGQPFTALNGGPVFQFNEAISLQIYCKDQAEVDYYWNRLTEGGDENAQQCGWLKDKFGVSWQVVPEEWFEMAEHAGSEGYERAMEAMFQMKKLDIEALRRAFRGEVAGG